MYDWIIDPISRTPNYRRENVVDLTLTIADLLIPNSSSWDIARARHAFAAYDAEIILRLRPNRSR